MDRMAEALASTSHTDPKTPEDLDKLVEDALACPCVADMKEGVCGEQFVGSFSCFVKSQAEEKGADCVSFFKDLQQCMATHPEAFHEFFAEEGEGEIEGDNDKGAKKANE